jgi:hypothetical protein
MGLSVVGCRLSVVGCRLSVVEGENLPVLGECFGHADYINIFE